ncbi:Ger(x)C family spore germination protein [Paenibacillus soyae]|uniref:Ger(X)C family spore germination protein n=1 Tax=Paenibacillus soyae TaxID=2969249 RepID=A0A9X2MSA5_9BACL|nr:Ger(x)C family spore germination protein [Paenibacillus soyae]MCR2805367.1 Ger(x)C family spore germination protein [Paenibacillus soyae]
MSAKLRRLWAFPCCACLLLLMTGCWDRTEINDLAIVTAAGFDLTEDNKIKLSVQIYAPGNPGQQQGSMGSEPQIGGSEALVESAVGLDSADAAAQLQEHLSRNIFWGQADIFLIGEKLAKHGISEPLDFLTRHPHPRERANMYVIKGSPEDILKWQPNIERNSAEVMREMAVIQTGLNITLLETQVSLASETRTALMPIIKMTKSGNKASPTLVGAASFRNLKLSQEYNVKKTRGLLWLRNEIRESTITTKVDGSEGFASLNVFNTASTLIPSIGNGKWKIKVKLLATGNLTQNSTTANLSLPVEVKKLEEAFKKVLQERIEGSVRLAKKSRTDVLGFAEQFHRHYPKEWRASKKNWEEQFTQIEVDYDITLRIRRIGMTGRNQFLIEEEES